MVYKCCVLSCKGNYKNTPKVAVFSFPKENNLREQWVRAIHRDNFQPTQYSKVCELHFPESSIQRVSEYYDTDTGKKLLVSLQKPHLKTGSVPVIFPSCPTYLSSSTPTVRESVNERNQRKENTNLEHAIKESIRLKAEYEKKHSFSTFSEFILCLKNVNISNEWTTIQKDNMIIFAVIDIVTAPTVLLSAVINTDLKISLYVGKNELQRLQIQQFPKFINNINDLIDILDTFKTFGKTANIISLNDHLISVCDILKTVTQSLDEDKLTKRNFLCEQINLLNCRKNHVRYSSDFMILCSILFSISPHAYRFLRSAGSFTLPHPNTIHKICSKYNTSPSIEQDEANFLMYIKQKFSLLEDSDKIVTLMVDEIHLKAHLDYKGGNILGCAYKNVSAATSAQVFMIQSLLSSFKEVVHIYPVKTFNAEGLFTYIKQIIGFNVICVVTDNNSINRKAMSYFASPHQLRIVYNHPYNENQPLFYVLDSVHILKCIRNNW